MLLLLACTTHSIALPGTETGSPSDSTPTGTTDSDPTETETETETGEPTEPAAAACSPWFPLDVPGAWWVFDNGNSEIRADVGEPREWEGIEATPVEISYGGDVLMQYYTCTEEGLAVVGHAYGITYATGYTLTWDPPALFTPRELEPDMDWRTESVLTVRQGNGTDRYDVVATGRSRDWAEVDVPAGSFEAIYLTLDIGLGSTAEQYLTEDVGEVLGSVGELLDYEVPQ